MKHHEYFVYIVTNQGKRTLYIGVTNNLIQRITEHYLNRGSEKSFAGKYNCHYLIYFEKITDINLAIRLEKQLKGWTRKKKKELILSSNPDWKFLNKDIMDWPPPTDADSRG